jgi:hypothetical protein
MHEITHWFMHFTGADNVSGPAYGFWSGFGSDLSEFAGLGIVYRILKCHENGCWRFGKHHFDNGKYKYCKKHHPEIGAKHGK